MCGPQTRHTFRPVCLVSVVLSYFVIRKPPRQKGPLFRCEDGSSLSHPLFVTRLRSTLETAGKEASHFSGHSFHIAAARGVPDSTIQTLGWWSRHLQMIHLHSPWLMCKCLTADRYALTVPPQHVWAK